MILAPNLRGIGGGVKYHCDLSRWKGGLGAIKVVTATGTLPMMPAGM
jgi:hypothetical protein